MGTAFPRSPCGTRRLGKEKKERLFWKAVLAWDKTVPRTGRAKPPYLSSPLMALGILLLQAKKNLEGQFYIYVTVAAQICSFLLLVLRFCAPLVCQG
jgi:hypothetical protein